MKTTLNNETLPNLTKFRSINHTPEREQKMIPTQSNKWMKTDKFITPNIHRSLNKNLSMTKNDGKSSQDISQENSYNLLNPYL